MPVSIKPLLAAGFSLKGLKKWSTHDGGGYQFTLTVNGKPVALITNEGRGGPLRFDWEGITPNGNVFVPTHATPAQRRVIEAKAKVAREAKAKLDEIVAAAPEVEAYGMMLKPNADWFMEELVNHADLVRVCKRKTAFRLPEDGDHQFHVLNAPYTPEVKAYIERQWPKAVILNDDLTS